MVHVLSTCIGDAQFALISDGLHTPKTDERMSLTPFRHRFEIREEPVSPDKQCSTFPDFCGFLRPL
jgi:hypothetical protein